MKVKFIPTNRSASGAVAVGVLLNGKLTPSADKLDKKTGGALNRAIKASSSFNGDKGQYIELVGVRGTRHSKILLAGLGDPKNIDFRTYESLGGSFVKRIGSTDSEATISIDQIVGSNVDSSDAAARVAYGAILGGYNFTHYKTKINQAKKIKIKNLSVSAPNQLKAKKVFLDLKQISDGVCLARNLVSEPGNVIYPRTLADKALELESLGIKVEILNKNRLEKIGMRTLLAVAQGSDFDPFVVVMSWNGAEDPKTKPIAFVGKGVTFDSGGLSIKPSSGMEEMKFDMAGSAAVIGTMRALAGRKAKVNAVGVIGLVENMPSAKAQRPGDIVKSLSGQTIEVLNTDAEGRLVLADCLWYTKERFKPKAMINLATLTGAIIVSLGHQYAGVFSNDDSLVKKLKNSGTHEGEEVWRMPLGVEYDRMIDSSIADMKNIGGRGAGSITAAQFLKRFVGNIPWVHIDIAGTAWCYKDKPTVPKGASGFGVRLLNRLVKDSFEDITD